MRSRWAPGLGVVCMAHHGCGAMSGWANSASRAAKRVSDGSNSASKAARRAAEFSSDIVGAGTGRKAETKCRGTKRAKAKRVAHPGSRDLTGKELENKLQVSEFQKHLRTGSSSGRVDQSRRSVRTLDPGLINVSRRFQGEHTTYSPS